MRRRLPALLALLIAASATGVAGCATVQPWERDVLGHPCMDPAPRLGDAYHVHLLPVREGALGGTAGLGGGCGCN